MIVNTFKVPGFKKKTKNPCPSLCFLILQANYWLINDRIDSNKSQSLFVCGEVWSRWENKSRQKVKEQGTGIKFSLSGTLSQGPLTAQLCDWGERWKVRVGLQCQVPGQPRVMDSIDNVWSGGGGVVVTSMCPLSAYSPELHVHTGTLPFCFCFFFLGSKTM